MVVIVAPVREGKLMMSNDQRKIIQQQIKSLDGKDAKLYLTKYMRQRTNRQNRYYWGVVIDMIANETGYSPEEVHEAMKGKFLGRRFIPMGNGEAEITKTTTDISTEEMTKYIEQIRAFAAQFLQMNIPSPDEANIPHD